MDFPRKLTRFRPPTRIDGSPIGLRSDESSRYPVETECTSCLLYVSDMKHRRRLRAFCRRNCTGLIVSTYLDQVKYMIVFMTRVTTMYTAKATMMNMFTSQNAAKIMAMGPYTIVKGLIILSKDVTASHGYLRQTTRSKNNILISDRQELRLQRSNCDRSFGPDSN